MTTNGYIQPEELFTVPKRQFADVEIKDLGRFRLRTLNAKEAAEYAAERYNKRGEINRYSIVSANARVIQLCCVDSEGNQIFSKADIEKIQELPAGKVAALAEACLDHSGLNEEEDAAKN